MMPKYIVTAPSHLHPPGGALRVYNVGEIIEYVGEPGTALAPMDADAFAAHVAVRARFVRPGRPWERTQWGRQFNLNLTKLSTTQLAAYRSAETAYAAAQAEQ